MEQERLMIEAAQKDPGRFAEQVVEQDVGGVPRARAGKIADNAVETEQRPQEKNSTLSYGDVWT